MVPTAITRRTFGRRALGAAGLAMAATHLPRHPALAAELAAPADRVILTISGKIRNTNTAGTAQFDRAMLEGLGMTGFDTHTPWYDKTVRFEGPLMRQLLETVGAYGDIVEAHALNDYSTNIPIADFTQYGAILAMKRDGAYLTVRDKGPLFVVYPYDSDAELRQQKYYGRSAWQVASFIIK